ncbi:hypothetical protein Tco_0929225, partial [Tanacetum coccineum]
KSRALIGSLKLPNPVDVEKAQGVMDFALFSLTKQAQAVTSRNDSLAIHKDDDVVVLENSKTKEEDVKEDESYHNMERYTFEDVDDDREFDDLD